MEREISNFNFFEGFCLPQAFFNEESSIWILNGLIIHTFRSSGLNILKNDTVDRFDNIIHVIARIAGKENHCFFIANESSKVGTKPYPTTCMLDKEEL